MAYSLLAPGKRLRPILCLLAAEACGGAHERALPGACAVEMVHAYSLIHDDLPAMDDDDLRRGRPTCHKVFGEAMAILAGDALLSLAFEVLAKEVTPPEAAAESVAVLGEMSGRCQLVGGQADDIMAEQSPERVASLDRDAALAFLHAIHHRKTGAMIRASLRLGAISARANARQTAALDAFGRQVGLAFQITDDLLDVRGAEADVGKRVGKDAAMGKLTFPALLGLDASEALAAQCVAEACEAIAPMGDAAEGLAALARYVLERNR